MKIPYAPVIFKGSTSRFRDLTLKNRLQLIYVAFFGDNMIVESGEAIIPTETVEKIYKTVIARKNGARAAK